MTDPRLLIFDFDGTLANTFPEIAAALNATRAHFGFEESDPETIRGWIGYGLPYFMAQAVPEEERSDAAVEAFTREYRRLYRDVAFERPKLFDGVRELLDALRDDVLAVVSNKSIEQLAPMLRRLDVEERFAVVLGGDSLPVRKPAREVYDHVAEATGLAGRGGWMIGDSEPDIELGVAAGLTTAGCLWGLRTREELTRAGAVHLVDTPSALHALLKP